MDSYSLQFKIRHKMPLTPAELALVTKSTNDDGVVSRRRFTGLAEYPHSVIDNLKG